MDGATLDPYDLEGPFHCPDCGRPKLDRLLISAWTPLRERLNPSGGRHAVPELRLTGCATCDAVITAHRCPQRPRLEDLCDGDQWKCRDCGAVWTATVEVVVSEERSWSVSRDAAEPATPEG